MEDATESVPRSPEKRGECLCLAALITVGDHALPEWAWSTALMHLPGAFVVRLDQTIGLDNYLDLMSLSYGLLLAVPSAGRSGILVGDIRTHVRGTAVLCGLPVVVTVLVYSLLPMRSFAEERVGFWLISPPAQDLVFAGYLYGRLELQFPAYLHRRVPVRWSLIITSLFFSAWHLANLRSIEIGFVAFQVLYTFAAYALLGLSRQWTGSILYLMLAHMTCNWLAWQMG